MEAEKSLEDKVDTKLYTGWRIVIPGYSLYRAFKYEDLSKEFAACFDFAKILIYTASCVYMHFIFASLS